MPTLRFPPRPVRPSPFRTLPLRSLRSFILGLAASILLSAAPPSPALPMPGAAFARLRISAEAAPLAPARPDDEAAFFVADHLAPGLRIVPFPPTEGWTAPRLVDSVAQDGRFSLEVSLRADIPSGCALCLPSPLDLSAGDNVLELRVRGALGGEVFNIGLLDDGMNGVRRPVQAKVSSRSFGRVPRGNWAVFRIPLSAFGGRGSYLHPLTREPGFDAVNRSGIRCLTLDLEAGRNRGFRIWIDEACILRGALPAGQATGSGYPHANLSPEPNPGAGP